MVLPSLPPADSPGTSPLPWHDIARDVRRTRFRTVRAGLAPEDVYAFLDDLATVLDDLASRLAAAQERATQVGEDRS